MGLEPSSTPLDKRAFERFTFSIDTLLESSAISAHQYHVCFFMGHFKQLCRVPQQVEHRGAERIVAASGLEHVLILCPSSLQIEQRGLVFTREILVAETGFSSFPGFGLLM